MGSIKLTQLNTFHAAATDTTCFVIPAKAGIYDFRGYWIPAFAGMTVRERDG